MDEDILDTCGATDEPKVSTTGSVTLKVEAGGAESKARGRKKSEGRGHDGHVLPGKESEVAGILEK